MQAHTQTIRTHAQIRTHTSKDIHIHTYNIYTLNAKT